MIWPYVVTFVLSTVVGYLLTQVPKTQTQPPSGLGDFKVPTAEEGRDIPVLFGTRLLESPNVVWYGHLRVNKITKKVSGGK